MAGLGSRGAPLGVICVENWHQEATQIMYRYEAVVGQVQEWISTGVLKPGDRLLSIRDMSAKLGYSTVTVYQAYRMLEDDGTLETRSRSGFFVSTGAKPLAEFGKMRPDWDTGSVSQTGNVDIAPISLPRDLDGFGARTVSEDLLPLAELYRLLGKNLRQEACYRNSLPWNGLEALRDVVARQIGDTSSRTHGRNIVITRGTCTALQLTLNHLRKEKGKVIVETPMASDWVSTVLASGRELVEIYSHPRYGVDPEQFQYLLDHNDVAACVLSPINHSPTGVSYSVDVAQRIVEAATGKNVKIIENMAGRDLYYTGPPAFDLAQFDTRNLVVRVGGFAETLGARFGLGWIVSSPRDLQEIRATVEADVVLAGDRAIQTTLAEFLVKRSYDRHLRKLRESLSTRMRRGLSLMFQTFPDNCTVSRPHGGYVCWVRGPKEFDALNAAAKARTNAVGFGPGPLFSVTRWFNNFIALNLSYEWTPQRERQLALIGELLRAH